MTSELTAAEIDDLRALCRTILPSGPAGPGADEAGVLTYILGQLHGAWGQGARMYRHGPFARPDHAGHGWQSPMTPLEVYRHGLEVIAEHCRRRYRGTPATMCPDQLTELMTEWTSGGIEGFVELSPEEFFRMVRANVAEGLFSDPKYGGNRELIGWRWLGYPGVADAHGGYAHLIARPDAPPIIEPKGLP